MRSSKLQFKGWLLVPLLVGLVGLQIITPSRVWMTLVVGLSTTLAISWVWARQMQKHVYLIREKRYGWTHVGDRLEERFTLHNHSLLPALWVEIGDASDIPGYWPGRVTGVEGNGVNRWIMTGVCRQRGVFNLGPTTLRLGDPFGLFSVTHHFPATLPLLVLPAVLDLPGIQVASGGQAGEGRPRPYAPQPMLLAASVRPYVPGDSLRLVHWPTTARRDSWFVRTFDGSLSGAWWIILDLAENVHSGEGDQSTLEQGVTLAASLAEMGLQADRPVGLVAHGQESVWLPSLSGETHRLNILKTLATIEPGTHSLSSLLRHVAKVLKQAASLIVITPATDTTWLDPLLLMRQRGLIPTVMLLSGQSGSTRTAAFHQLLIQEGVTTYLPEPETLAPRLDPARLQGQWEWHTTALGRAIPIRQPQGQWEVLQ